MGTTKNHKCKEFRLNSPNSRASTKKLKKTKWAMEPKVKSSRSSDATIQRDKSTPPRSTTPRKVAKSKLSSRLKSSCTPSFRKLVSSVSSSSTSTREKERS